MAIAALAVLAASLAQAAPAPSLEAGFGQARGALQAAVAAETLLAAKTLGRIDNLAWELQRADDLTSRLRRDLTWLRIRASRHDRERGPQNDPMLRWDIQRFLQEARDLTRGAQWRAEEIGRIAERSGADDALVFPARRLYDAAQRLRETTRMLGFDGRMAAFDFMRAGFAFEGIEIGREAAEAETQGREIADQARRLLDKVSGA